MTQKFLIPEEIACIDEVLADCLTQLELGSSEYEGFREGMDIFCNIVSEENCFQSEMVEQMESKIEEYSSPTTMYNEALLAALEIAIGMLR